MPPLGPCGCIRDPGHDRHHCGDQITEPMVDAGRAAAAHLLELGYTPILRRDTLTTLYRRGGDDRQLAQHLYTLAGGET